VLQCPGILKRNTSEAFEYDITTLGDRRFVASNTRELMGVIVAVVVVDMLATAEVMLQFRFGAFYLYGT
jgi:hypothetical protein